MIQHKYVLIFLFALGFNTAIIVSALKCFKCENCADTTNIKVDDCSGTEDTCYTSIQNGKLTRGCRTGSADCTPNNNCISCTGEGCNTQNVCQKCESSSESSCLILSNPDWKLAEICPSANTKCLINIKDDKTTERRCATANDNCQSDTCKLCDQGNCNINPFPANRISCYQCEAGSKGCDNIHSDSNPFTSMPCALYDNKDQCYMIGADSANIRRGCVSDLKNEKCKSDNPDERCYICNKSNCNEYTFKKNQSQKCIQCSDNEKCVSAQEPNEAKDCKNQIEYWMKEMCYTQFKDGKVNRGCYYDRENSLGECNTNSGCGTCSDGNGCNKAAYQAPEFTCIRCRSDNNYDCYNNADKIGGEKCRNQVPDDNKKCFHGIWNGVVIRGCMVDADSRAQALCNDEKSMQCKTCADKDCNSKKTSGVKALSGLAILTTLFLAIIVQQF